MQQAINILRHSIDVNIVKEIWEETLKTIWQKPPVWVHGNISAGNILLKKRKITRSNRFWRFIYRKSCL